MMMVLPEEKETVLVHGLAGFALGPVRPWQSGRSPEACRLREGPQDRTRPAGGTSRTVRTYSEGISQSVCTERGAWRGGYYTSFYYEGWRVVEERTPTLTASPPTVDAISQQYTYGNYLDEVWTLDDRSAGTGGTVAQLNDQTAGQRKFYHNNTLFHVYGITDEVAGLVEAYQYDAYGKQTVITDGNDGDTIVNFGANDVRTVGGNSTVGNPKMYCGYRFDPETGVYFVNNRYFSADFGRWLSRDPVKYFGGLSLYQYVASNPMFWVDPLGLFNCPVTVSIQEDTGKTFEEAWKSSGHGQEETTEYGGGVIGDPTKGGEKVTPPGPSTEEAAGAAVEVTEYLNLPGATGTYHTHPYTKKEIKALPEMEKGTPHSYGDLIGQARTRKNEQFAFVITECCIYLTIRTSGTPNFVAKAERVRMQKQGASLPNFEQEAAFLAERLEMCFYKSCGEDRKKGIFRLYQLSQEQKDKATTSGFPTIKMPDTGKGADEGCCITNIKGK